LKKVDCIFPSFANLACYLRSGITGSVVNYSTGNDSALLSDEQGGKNEK